MLTVVFLKSSQAIAARAESQKNGFRIKRYIALPVGKIGSKIQQVLSYRQHSSEIRGLSLTKCSSETLKNLLCFM